MFTNKVKAQSPNNAVFPSSVEKIANEAPIPVFNHQSEEWNLGGCGNVLKNLHSLGCEKLYIFSAVGADDNGKTINSRV